VEDVQIKLSNSQITSGAELKNSKEDFKSGLRYMYNTISVTEDAECYLNGQEQGSKKSKMQRSLYMENSGQHRETDTNQVYLNTEGNTNEDRLGQIMDMSAAFSHSVNQELRFNSQSMILPDINYEEYVDTYNAELKLDPPFPIYSELISEHLRH
jgi:hypothetical protein